MVDELDVQILSELVRDSRQSYRKIAEKLKVATGTIQNRILKMELEKVIKSYSANIDTQKVGYNISALIALCIDRAQLKQVEEKFVKHPNVLEMFKITGEYDAMIRVSFKSMSELNEFITKKLKEQGINKTVTFIILDTMKESLNLLR